MKKTITGNVGIGTTAPSSLLTLNKSAISSLVSIGGYALQINQGIGLGIGTDSDFAYIQSFNTKPPVEIPMRPISSRRLVVTFSLFFKGIAKKEKPLCFAEGSVLARVK